jgi:predicted transcriptional regulator
VNKAAILAEILAASQPQAQEIPPDCVTYAEIEAELHCSHSRAQRVMADLVAAGQYERVEMHGRTKVVFRKIK